MADVNRRPWPAPDALALKDIFCHRSDRAGSGCEKCSQTNLHGPLTIAGRRKNSDLHRHQSVLWQFRVERRRTIQLMHHFDDHQVGRTFLIDRKKLGQSALQRVPFGAH